MAHPQSLEETIDELQQRLVSLSMENDFFKGQVKDCVVAIDNGYPDLALRKLRGLDAFLGQPNYKIV